VSKLLLRIEPHLGEAFSHSVEGDSLVMGRSSKADLVIPDPYISRLQARLYRDGGRWLVEDLGGRNPTLLNGQPVTQAVRITPGDVLTVSETRIRVETAVLRDDPPSGATIYRPARALIDPQDTETGAEAAPVALKRLRDRFRRLNEFNRALAGPISQEGLLALVLDRAFADFRPEEAVVFLRDANGDFRQAAARRMPGAGGNFLYSRSLIREVTEKGLAALVHDASSDERFSSSESILSSGVRSLAAAPLLDPEGCPGMIVLSSRIHMRSFSEEDLEELVSLASAAALRLRNIALAEEAAQRQVLEKELSLARQIQIALLPASLPTFDGYELVASNFPTRAVSGDLYQVQSRRDGRECVILLADVAGKGISAALLTASLEALAAGPIEVGQEPDVIFEQLSRRLHARTSPERYATGFLAVLHTDTGRFCYASAGHNPALLLRASGGVEQLGATGLPLGLLPVGDYLREERMLAPGDTVVLYTDGITEAANPAREEYGLERLIEVCRAKAAEGVEKLGAALQTDLDAFAQGVSFADDRTLVLLRRLR
jgi:sigma-B regulation protein RsbU (phosphoserine phosphatase)